MHPARGSAKLTFDNAITYEGDVYLTFVRIENTWCGRGTFLHSNPGQLLAEASTPILEVAALKIRVIVQPATHIINDMTAVEIVTIGPPL